MSVSSVAIIGGHGEIALRLADLLLPKYRVTSFVRRESHFPSIRATGATPVLADLEKDSVTTFTKLFDETQPDVIVFSAGAGDGNWQAKVKTIDYAGAVKVFNAIEAMRKPARLLLVSTVDSRDVNTVPAHYDDTDVAASRQYRVMLGAYLPWKYEADKELWKRDKFKWTIVRPGWLTNAPGKGTAEIGTTHITRGISRDDVATMLALLVERPDAAGLALDITGGDTRIEASLNKAIEKRETNTY